MCSHRARFTRWVCRRGIDPDKPPLWLRPLMGRLFSYRLYIYLCGHMVWVEAKRKTDPVVWLAEIIAGKEDVG